MIYLITEAQRLEAMDALYLPSMKTEAMLKQKDKAYVMLQSLTPVDAQETKPKGWLSENGHLYEHLASAGDNAIPLYTHPAPLGELTPVEPDGDHLTIAYLDGYHKGRDAQDGLSQQYAKLAQHCTMLESKLAAYERREPIWFYKIGVHGEHRFYDQVETQPEGCTPLFTAPEVK